MAPQSLSADPLAAPDVLSGSVSVEVGSGSAVGRAGGRRVLVLDGEVDAAVLDDFRARAGDEPPVVDAIDARGVTYLCAQGLCLLVTSRVASRAAGRAGELVDRSPTVDRLIEISGLGTVFPR